MLYELELNKLFNEINYLVEDYNIKSLMNIELEKIFMKEVYNHLPNNIINIKDVNDINHETSYKQDKDIKYLYRTLVKETHPDKNINNVEYFNKITTYYENCDYLSLVKISKQLNIPCKINKERIIKEMNDLRLKCTLIENSLHWKWYKEKNMKYINEYINYYTQK